VHPTPLMGRALEAACEGGDETGVLVGDDQPHPRQAPALEPGQEAAPEHFVLAVTHVQAEDLAAAVGGDPGRHHHGHRHDLGSRVAHVQIGRIEVDVREGGVVQPPGSRYGQSSAQPVTNREHRIEARAGSGSPCAPMVIRRRRAGRDSSVLASTLVCIRPEALRLFEPYGVRIGRNWGIGQDSLMCSRIAVPRCRGIE
jgi:hypothetical protein